MKRVTLRTLPDATEQEIFDWVTINLLEQGEKSIIGKGCQYRVYKSNGDVLKCAAGWLMTEKEYKKRFDNGDFATDWAALVSEELVPEEHSEFIWRLQKVHDCTAIRSWKKEFRDIAAEYQLEVNFDR